MTKIYLETYGCSFNQADSEAMAGILESYDFNIVNDIEEADLIIINTCTVKGPTENLFFKRLDLIKKNLKNKKIIIAGCISQTDPEKLQGYSLVGTNQIHNIAQAVEEEINDNHLVLLDQEAPNRLSLPKIRKNKIIEIIPIAEGCLGEPCSYCKVKDARGHLISYPINDIVKQARKAIAQGCKEIWLTAQDTGCYGKDIDTNLPELLKKITEINGNFFVRVGMMNPNHAIEFLDELIEAMQHDKMFKFLHIPVQSGNDEILYMMRRKYKVDDFMLIINKIKNITISTDIICGFPTETEEQFNDSLNLIKEIKPDVLNISRFWPRPKTEAEKMDGQIDGGETKRRSRILTDVYLNIARMNNEKWLDWEGEILIDEKGKEGTFIGRNFAYKPVVVKGDFELGEKVKVKINNVTSFDLRT